jgi:uncharacterized protein (DUF2147 family)
VKQLFFILSILIASISINAQSDSDRILGVWLNNTKDAKIKIFEKEGKYFGKIVWFAMPNIQDFPSKTDNQNRDPEQIKSKIIGLEILSNLEYENGEWVDGEIYSPKKKEKADCKIKISDDNRELFVTASKGFLFSKTVVWTRAVEE